jgi:hypothetical protein
MPKAVVEAYNGFKDSCELPMSGRSEIATSEKVNLEGKVQELEA